MKFRYLMLGAALTVSMPITANAATKARVIDNCEFQACTLGTTECCKLAAQQKNICLQTDAANASAYPVAREAVGECAYCSQVYINNFCKRKK